MAGLRETKKRRTREAIAQAAADLFVERGFDAVTVEDVARAAGVSRQTVFNYFPTKEQMLFDREEEVGAALVALVADPADGAALVDAFRGHTRAFWERFGAVLDEGGDTHGFWEIVRSSPALRDYAEASAGRQAREVGAALARAWGQPPGDPMCEALARMLCGVNVAFLTRGLERLADGEDPRTVVAEMIARSGEAYDAVARGLARYAPRAI
ncbi:MAG TPA: TetR family transcriptional regulator [Solirubrobacteraceae bacterium]|nr:TetR family transcriptional regulator [Solirubrobacteraceae bacterium]